MGAFQKSVTYIKANRLLATYKNDNDNDNFKSAM